MEKGVIYLYIYSRLNGEVFQFVVPIYFCAFITHEPVGSLTTNRSPWCDLLLLLLFAGQ